MGGIVVRNLLGWAFRGWAVVAYLGILVTSDGGWTMVWASLLLILLVVAYGLGVTETQNAWVQYHTQRTVETFERMSDEDDR